MSTRCARTWVPPNMALHLTSGRLRLPLAGERQGVRQSSAHGCGNLSAGGKVAASRGRCSSSRRGSADRSAEVRFGNCAGAYLPLAKIFAALVGPFALGWLIPPADNTEARGSSPGRRKCATMRGRSNTTISLIAANAVAPRSSCWPMAAKASQGGLMLSNMPLKLTRACQLSVDLQRAGAARPLR